jgi:ABC-type dipeptide/oligopeptide/nickel transport system permease subunit
MATIAETAVGGTAALRWELPAEKPLVTRLARPWLQNPAGLFGLVIVVAFLVLGIIGPYITPYDPRGADVDARFLGPSLEHPFGTNWRGQDMLSRVVQGTRLSFTFGAIVLVVGFVPGTILGIMSGHFGRWVDYLIQRSGEAWTAFPQLPILLTVIAAVGPGLKAAIIVVALGALFGGSRVLRAVALVERHKEYVLAARSTGASEARILIWHIVPNLMPFILVGASSVFAAAVLIEAALSFLGLGHQVGTPGWGIDLSVGLKKGTDYPHLVIFPGLVISVVVLGFNLLGDTLRDLLDPRLRGSLRK